MAISILSVEQRLTESVFTADCGEFLKIIGFSGYTNTVPRFTK